MCTSFVAPAFTEAELDFVAAETRKILNPSLLETASELTNNGIVNIYMNHARIWRHIAKRWDVALVPRGHHSALERRQGHYTDIVGPAPGQRD